MSTKLVNGVRIEMTQAEIDAITPSLEQILSELKDECEESLKSKIDEKFNTLKNGYSEREMQTWPFQVEEARIILNGGTPEGEFLLNAKDESQTVEEYAQKVMSNNIAWSQFGGQIIKWRSGVELLLKNASTEDDYLNVLEVITDA